MDRLGKTTLCILGLMIYNSILDNNKVFINLYFLLKLNWMKKEWDQARLSSLE